MVLDPSPGKDVLGQIIQKQDCERIKVLLRSLPEGEREMIRLRYAAQLSYVEIARVMGRREDAVRKALKRLLTRLAGRLEFRSV